MYPDEYKDKDYFLSDRFIGGSWESLPVDLSQTRLCEVRCFGVNDDMSNWAPKPKFMLAEGDTYMKVPSDETYPLLAINYLKLDKVPAYNESWAPVVEGIRAAISSAPPAKFSSTSGASKDRARKASTRPASNTLFRWNLPSWCGATARKSIAKSSSSPIPSLSAPKISAFRSTRRARSGCASTCGTRPATARGCNRFNSNESAP